METNAVRINSGWNDSVPTKDRNENDHLTLTSNVKHGLLTDEAECVCIQSESLESGQLTENLQNQRLPLVGNSKVGLSTVHTGLFICFNEQKGYGYIKTVNFGDVICMDPMLLKLKKDDLVLFHIKPSPEYPGKYVAKNVRRAFHTKDNRVVTATTNTIVSASVLEILPMVLKMIECENRESFFEQVIFDYPIGNTNCVEVSKKDKIIYAKKQGGSGNYCKYVKFRLPQLSDTVTVILKKKHDYFSIIDAYIGEKAEPMPLDKKATELSVDYWDNHALIYNPQDVAVSSETRTCPWHKEHKSGILNITSIIKSS